MPDTIQIRDIRRRVDFAVITIRPDEFKAVLDRFPDRRTAGGGRQLYEYATITSTSGRQYGVAVVRSLEQGQTSAQSLTRDVIDDLDPGWLILAGIAGAAPDHGFSLGDVCLASRLHDFSITAAIEGKQPTYEQTGGPMHRDVERLLRWLPAARDRLGSWNTEEAIGRSKPRVGVPKRVDSRLLYGPNEAKEKVRDSLARHFPSGGKVRPPLFHVGPGATSGTLVKDTTLLKRWHESARHLTHVEMEAGGTYDAARHGGDREYPLLCVRGISDVIGFERDPAWIEYACHSAASFLHALLVHAPVDWNVPDSAVTRNAWAALQERLTEDVSEIAEWSQERTEVEKVVLAVRAVRHGLDKVSAKRFHDPENLKTFVDLLEELVSRCIDRIPRQARNEDVKRALLAAVDRLRDLSYSKAGICVTAALTIIMAAFSARTWESHAGVALASTLLGLASAVAFLLLLLRK